MKLNIIGVLFAAGLGLAVASPAAADAIGVGPPAADQEAGHAVDKNKPSASNGNNGPYAVWVLPALLIAGFAAGYGVRSLLSVRRHRRARARYNSLTSGRLHQLKADNSDLSIVSRDVGDLQSPPRSRTASRSGQSS